MCLVQVGPCGGSVGWATALQAGRLRVRFPMVSLEIFVDIILPAVLGAGGLHSCHCHMPQHPGTLRVCPEDCFTLIGFASYSWRPQTSGRHVNPNFNRYYSIRFTRYCASDCTTGKQKFIRESFPNPQRVRRFGNDTVMVKVFQNHWRGLNPGRSALIPTLGSHGVLTL